MGGHNKILVPHPSVLMRYFLFTIGATPGDKNMATTPKCEHLPKTFWLIVFQDKSEMVRRLRTWLRNRFRSVSANCKLQVPSKVGTQKVDRSTEGLEAHGA